jgi:hypothetical protein
MHWAEINSVFFFGKSFLAMINALMGLRHDFLSMPDAKGAPNIIQAWTYLGRKESS